MAIEMIQSYGASVGSSIFITCYWIGRFIEAWEAKGRDLGRSEKDWTWVYRREVKKAVCGTQRANDAKVRSALMNRWGGKKAAIGKGGPLEGIVYDEWAALGVAVTWALSNPDKSNVEQETRTCPSISPTTSPPS